MVTPAGNGSLPHDFSPVQLANALAAMPVRLNDVTASSKEARAGFAFFGLSGCGATVAASSPMPSRAACRPCCSTQRTSHGRTIGAFHTGCA